MFYQANINLELIMLLQEVQIVQLMDMISIRILLPIQVQIEEIF
jgi:hypothetical protein